MSTPEAWTTHVLSPDEERLCIPGFRLTVVRGPDKGKRHAPYART